MRKNSLAKELLEHFAICGVVSTISVLLTPHGTSMGRALREGERWAASCLHDFSRRQQGTVSVALHRLKRCGLVERKGAKKNAVWQSTPAGNCYFKRLTQMSVLPVVDGKLRLVTFDIPEEDRIKRAWLRMQLVAHRYIFLQKSVWVGKTPLSPEFIRGIKDRGLGQCVHVIDVSGNGTIASRRD